MSERSSIDADYLDRYAREYYLDQNQHDLWIEEAAQRSLIAHLMREQVLTGSVLDLGFGTGFAYSELRAVGIQPDVVEGSPILVTTAKERYPDISIFQTMFEDFSPSVLYETVLCWFILEHVDDPARLLTLARRWIAPGGKLVVAVPNALSLHRLLGEAIDPSSTRYTLSARDHVVGHLRVFDHEILGRTFVEAGLEVVHCSTSFLKSVPNSWMVGWPPAAVNAFAQWDPGALGMAGANLVMVGRVPS